MPARKVQLQSDRRQRIDKDQREPTPAMDYPTWKANAAAELRRLHGVSAIAMPEREWKRLFIRRLTPSEAAEQAKVYNYNTRQPGERLRHRAHR